MTKEEDKQLKQHMQQTYGKGCKLYEEQVVQNCIDVIQSNQYYLILFFSYQGKKQRY